MTRLLPCTPLYYGNCPRGDFLGYFRKIVLIILSAGKRECSGVIASSCLLKGVAVYLCFGKFNRDNYAAE